MVEKQEMTLSNSRNKAFVAGIAIAAVAAAAVAVSVYFPGTSTIPWWKSLSFQLLYSPKDVDLMEKLERISLAADLCKAAGQTFESELAKNGRKIAAVSSETKKKLLEASVDLDYLFSVLDKDEFSTGIADVKKRRKELVDKCVGIGKHIDHLVGDMKELERMSE